MSDSPLLSIQGLRVGFDTESGPVVAVDGIDLSLARGRTLGLVGESGCGKSVTAFSIMRLLPYPHGKILGGRIEFDGRHLATLALPEMASLRGREIGMIFQEPMTALNPVQPIGRQLAEAVTLHHSLPPAEVRRRCLDMLARVRIPSPEVRLNEYPHQLSGGMRQRVMIAMALINKPKLLIADEPTTALDVTVQAQILELIAELQRDMGMAVLLITHDLGVIAETSDEVAVMYAGRLVERAPVRDLFARPRHAYTRGLLESIPRLDSTPKTKLPAIPGQVAAITDFVEGCRFAQRLGLDPGPTRPPFIESAPGHWVEDFAPVVLEG
ncbi:MAG: ABC transporter ATP-binding protein [Verrucomicrobiales bacterium]